MPTSTLSAVLVPPEAVILPEPVGSELAAPTAIPPVALSARARERLRVLNEVLASVPGPADDHRSASEAAKGE